MMPLSKACSYVTAKMDATDSVLDSYVSTENLLSNKEGRRRASGTPVHGTVTSYSCGDILISNIRPYFKKIWYADNDGTCSNDVLCVRANDKKRSGLLFFALYADAFFAHVTQGSRGTKMPRGDKAQIMQYKICDIDSAIAQDEFNVLLKLVSNNNGQIVCLENLRDALLPKLMSGEIDVSQVDLTQPNNHLHGFLLISSLS